MKRISIISALLLAVLMAGCAAATAPCDAQTPELPPQAEVAMDSEGIGEIQERLLDIAFDNEYDKERPTRLQVMGIVLSIAGVICIALVKGFSASLNPLGYAMLFVAVMGDVGYAIAAQGG